MEIDHATIGAQMNPFRLRAKTASASKSGFLHYSKQSIIHFTCQSLGPSDMFFYVGRDSSLRAFLHLIRMRMFATGFPVLTASIFA
jgi:hypothetical protein